MHTAPQRVIVIHSPHSGRSGKLSQALAHLQQQGVVVEDTISITALDTLPPQGAGWKERGIDVALAAGGDGTVGGTIMHIAESGLPLGILPLGTSNDIARSLRLPQDLESAVRVITQRNAREVDVGTARPAEQAPHAASEHQHGPVKTQITADKRGFFAHALTIGANVQFARIATNVATRKRFGHLTYPVAAIEVMFRHEALEVQLEFEGLAIPQANTSNQEHVKAAPADLPRTLKCRALQVTVVNAPIFGGRWNFALPAAHIGDRLLDIVVMEDIEIRHIDQWVAASGENEDVVDTNLSGQERQYKHHPAELSHIAGIHHLQAWGVTITTHADPRDVTLDGEVRGQTPMYVHVAHERLRVIAPR